MEKSYELVINLFHVSSAGLSCQKLANIFLDGEYINTVQIDTSYGKDNGGDNKNLIESKIIEKMFLDKDFSYNCQRQDSVECESSGSHAKKAEVFEYKITPKGKKTTFQLIRRKKGKSSWSSVDLDYHRYNIIDIFEDKMTVKCWNPHGSSKHEFPAHIKKIADKIKETMEREFGVKVKLGTIPTYRYIQSYHVDYGKVSFNYKITKVVDKEKLEGDFKESYEIDKIIDEYFFDEFCARSNNESDVLILEMNKNVKVNLYKATDYMFRNTKYMHVIKKYEKDLLEDFENYKIFLLSKMRVESTFVSMSSGMMHNFNKLMPKLYEKMFGNIPAGLIPSVYYRGAKSGEIDEIIKNKTFPKLIL
jgi:hypothetical protein